ncbi:universal stress protein [Bacillus sp. FJAT-22090]|uniref:universal stress protein n=1 Tax=Bacillus sp. FJAT-22090 TaxID=1581038 RepID=UPI0011A529B6|nr:universal stress protein [Bacillus sp. FJAT-22090]
MYEKILLAADGSTNSLRAATEAVKIAAFSPTCNVEIVFVADFSKSKNDILHAQGKEELELSRRKKVLPIEKQFQQQCIQYSVTILRGDPGPIIIEYANSNSFDLVIIGSRGLNTLQEMVLGSVSHKVVKRVNCPVLIVK